MPYHKDSFAVLRDSIIHSIQTLEIDNISQSLQTVYDQIEIPPVGECKVTDILEEKYLGFNASDCINEDGKAVAGIQNTLLFSPHAKGLAGRPPNDNIGIGIVKAHFQLDQITFPF